MCRLLPQDRELKMLRLRAARLYYYCDGLQEDRASLYSRKVKSIDDPEMLAIEDSKKKKKKKKKK